MSFEPETLTDAELAHLSELARLARGDIISMTSVAGSGHPGGSLSARAIKIRTALHAMRKCVAVINMACVAEIDEETDGRSPGSSPYRRV